MRSVFAHDAVLAAPAEADDAAPGAAVTVALCGHWEHEPPCPLAAHHCAVVRVGGELRLRILFAAEPADEAGVRRRIDAALAAGRLPGSDAAPAWALLRSSAGEVRADEQAHGERLRGS
jgi:hypothetical protein